MTIQTKPQKISYLYITHPDPNYDLRQQDELTRLTGEAKTCLSRMFVLGNASMGYYRQLEEAPTEQDFEQWLEGLPVRLQLTRERKVTKPAKRRSHFCALPSKCGTSA